MRTKPNRRRHLRMMLQTTTVVALATLFFGLTTANAEKIALTRATIINPGSSAVIHDGTLVIEGDQITGRREHNLEISVDIGDGSAGQVVGQGFREHVVVHSGIIPGQNAN